MWKTLSKTSSQRSVVWPGCDRKLKLELSGFDAGKFRIVQLPSIWICEGGTGVTLPSSTPPRSATQSSAKAGAAHIINTKAQNDHRVRRPPIFVPVDLLELMNTLVHSHAIHVVGDGDRGNPTSSGWIPAVPLSWGFRPVDRKLCVATFQ